MFKRILTAVMAPFLESYQRYREQRIESMNQEIESLKKLIGEPIIPTDEERKQLLALGAKIGHDEAANLIRVVDPDTYRRWVREEEEGKAADKPEDSAEP